MRPARPGFALRFAIVLVAIVLATVVAAPVAKLIADWLVVEQPAIADALHLKASGGSYDFGRVMRRVFMLVAILMIVAGRRWLGAVPLQGLRRDDARWRWLGVGLAAGLVSLGLFVAALVLTGRRTLELPPPAGWPLELLSAAAAALAVGLVEELALRGYLLGGLAREWPRGLAVLASSAFYAILHFVKAPVRVEPGLDPWIGIETLIAHLLPLGRPAILLPFVGLLLAGVVLSYAYLWTRSLPFAIGIHTGWVYLLLADGLFLRDQLGAQGLYGDRGLLAGLPGWLYLVAMLVALRLALRRRIAAPA